MLGSTVLLLSLATAPSGPSLDGWLNLPEWAHVGFTQRTRFELRDDRIGDDSLTRHLILYRTQLLGRLSFEHFGAELELIDARATITGGPLRLDSAFLAPLDILQAAVVLRSGAWLPDQELSLRVGRQTMDLGSRRLVARNGFRNTINAFGGARVDYAVQALELRAFALAPTRRRPAFGTAEPDQLDFALDEEDWQTWLLGLHGELAPVSWDRMSVELYGLGLLGSEDDGRRLFTGGLRLLRGPRAEDWDVELEGGLQVGETPAGAQRFAQFAHVEFGLTLAVPWSFRLSAALDYASGNDPNTPNDEDFDPLFGARAFDFGPTSLLVQAKRRNLTLLSVVGASRFNDWSKAQLAFRLFRNSVELGTAGSGYLLEARTGLQPWGPWLDFSVGASAGRFEAEGSNSVLYLFAQTTLRL